MNNIYFTQTHNGKLNYTHIWDIQKSIFDYFGIHYVEGIEYPSLVDPYVVRSIDNPVILLPHFDSPSKVNKYFGLTIYRWFMSTLSIFDDSDIFIINDCDLIQKDPVDVVETLVGELKNSPTKVITTYAYKDNPKHRFCSCYQAFYVKTLRDNLFNKYQTIQEILVSAGELGQTFSYGFDCIEEYWLGYRYYNRGLVKYLDWNHDQNRNHELTAPQVYNTKFGDLSNIDLDDYYTIHGYAGDENVGLYCEKLRILLNNYYSKHNIDLKL
jgi:hypothetical protein